MCDLSAADLLVGWERALGQSADEQALTLLAVALPDAAPEALARLTVGRRDAALLTLRERVFGPRLVSRTTCPSCGESLELDFAAGDIRASGSSSEAEGGGDEAALALTHSGYEVRFRLPNTLDVRAAGRAGTLQGARSALLERCVLEAWRSGDTVLASALPEAVREALASRMVELEPEADVRLALSCPACGYDWQAPFDIGAYLWEELHAWALRTLHDVHLLARNYGWREADILALSPRRRQIYLDMVQG